MKKRLLSMFLVIVTLILLTLPAAAGGEATPFYNNTVKTTTNFGISSSGVATVSLSYTGIRGVTSGATITTYLEKKILGLFWTRVDLGNANDEWVDTSESYTYATSHSVQLEGKGTYRASVIYEVSGSGGATDVVPYEMEKVY